MKKSIALKLIGGLGNVSKMPGSSYGLPTAECVTGSELAKIEGTICNKCYAKRGFYAKFAYTVVPAQYRKLNSLTDPQWVEAMIIALKHEVLFRWNDSGDIQSIEHLEKIVQVAVGTPWCKHWLATRERLMIKKWLNQGGVIPENLSIRVSATWTDSPVKHNLPGVGSSNVHKDKPPVGFECPAPKQHGKCDQCRACWDKSIQTISYKEH